MEMNQLQSTSQGSTFVNIPLRTVESHWEELFNQFDLHGNGRIPVKFLKSQLSQNNRGVPVYAIDRIIALSDKNHDGFITFPEFLRLVETPEAKRLFRPSLQRYIQTFVPRERRVVEAVDGSYEQEYTCSPPAVTMIIFSILMIIVYMYDKIVSGSTVSPRSTFFAIFVYDPHRRAEIWRFFTYMFVHANELHIAVNICVQILLGVPLEMVHKWWRILIIYLAGVASGSLFTSIVDPDVYLAGASGGVYSLLAAHIATIIINWTEMDFPFLQLCIFLILAGVDTGNAIYTRYVSQVDTKVAYAAHLAGALAGFLVGIYILRNLKVRRWERVLWWMCFVIFVIFIIVAIMWNVLDPKHFPPQKPFGKNIFPPARP